MNFERMVQATEYMKIAKEFHEIFGLKINEYMDELTTTQGAFSLDYPKFANYIESKFPYAEDDDVSLFDVVCKEYGTEAAKLIVRML